MGALGTFLKLQHYEHGRQSVDALRSIRLDSRERELRARGWVRPSYLPEDVAHVEHVLAAQMRARRAIRTEARLGRRPWPWTTTLLLGAAGVGFGAAMLAAGVASRDVLPGLLVVLMTVALVVVAVVRIRRREARWDEVRELARIVDGRCGWCGQPAPHMLEGEPTPPRVFHAVEIEQFVGIVH